MITHSCNIFIRRPVIWLICLMIMPGRAISADTTIDATVITRAALSVTANQHMNFGVIEFEPTHNGRLELGTDGSIAVDGSAVGLNISGGSPTPATVTLGGDGTSTVEISCMENGNLSNGSGQNITLFNVEMSIGIGVPSGGATACGGLGNAVSTVDLSTTPSPTIFVGGQLNLDNDAITNSSSYSTTLSGGVPITLRMVYQ